MANNEQNELEELSKPIKKLGVEEIKKKYSKYFQQFRE
jgi:hypothetical protein